MKYRLGDARVKTRPDSWIAPSAAMTGKVRLDAGASVWFGTVLYGNDGLIHTSEYSNVQDGSMMYTSTDYPLTLGRGITVGHNTMLYGYSMSDYSLVGISAMILDGAKVGRYCVIGTSALIPEGREAPDNLLVMGSSGKIVRELSKPRREMLGAGAAHYVRNARHYVRGLVEGPA